MPTLKISVIAAISKNLVIGRDNKIPWHIPEDLKRFKELTSGHVVIMGRKTFESIGKPLPNRTNIVITRDPDYLAEGILVCHSLEEALQKAQKTWIPDPFDAQGKQVRDDKPRDTSEIFIIGGGQIYKQAMSLTDKLYLTIVDEEVEGDTFFPDYSEFSKVISEQDIESNGKKIKFIDLQKLDLQKN